jgi:hypothetical protein
MKLVEGNLGKMQQFLGLIPRKNSNRSKSKQIELYQTKKLCRVKEAITE